MNAERSWSLRTARPEDAEAVSNLLARSYPLLWTGRYEPALLDTVLPLVTRANPRLLASKRFFVAISEEGPIVGCGGWSLEAPGTGERAPGIGHIRHFATDADWVRHGIGRAILSRCTADAAAEGVRTLLADSAKGAEAFYAAFGFVPQGPSAPLIGGVVLPGTMMKLVLQEESSAISA